ncbi:MAG: hypothetical protein R2882_11570 [Gemmatimonadales bacterium]
MACITASLLVTRGTIGFIPGTIACLVGIVGSDLWLYGMGRWLSCSSAPAGAAQVVRE